MMNVKESCVNYLYQYKDSTTQWLKDSTIQIPETNLKGINAKKFLMFYHHGGMRREYHDSYGYKKSEKVIAVSENIAQKLKEFRKK